MKKILVIICILTFLSACSTTPIIDLVNTAKCVTEVATKDSKFTCEFEGKKVLAKK